MVVSVVVDVDVSGVVMGVVASVGVVASIGVDVSIGVVVVVSDAGADASGEGEAAGTVVSVFCSHATKSAALARMQIYFFISVKDCLPI